MSFVPGFELDVFVFHAHADDRPHFEPRAGEEPPLSCSGAAIARTPIVLLADVGDHVKFKRLEAADTMWPSKKGLHRQERGRTS